MLVSSSAVISKPVSHRSSCFAPVALDIRAAPARGLSSHLWRSTHRPRCQSPLSEGSHVFGFLGNLTFL